VKKWFANVYSALSGVNKESEFWRNYSDKGKNCKNKEKTQRIFEFIKKRLYLRLTKYRKFSTDQCLGKTQTSAKFKLTSK
jgi:hypothetical protein